MVLARLSVRTVVLARLSGEDGGAWPGGREDGGACQVVGEDGGGACQVVVRTVVLAKVPGSWSVRTAVPGRWW